MSKISKIIEQFKKQDLSLEKRTNLAPQFKQELQKYESGDLTKFKNTAIYNCYKHYFNFYCSDLVKYI